MPYFVFGQKGMVAQRAFTALHGDAHNAKNLLAFQKSFEKTLHTYFKHVSQNQIHS